MLNRLSFLVALSILAAPATMAAQGAASQATQYAGEKAPEIRRNTPSGLPVPRFVSLKSDKTFCRIGPTFGHDVKITFMRRGLPVMVVAETRDHWRKVRDSEGDECWIHKSKLSGAKTALVMEDRLALRQKPRLSSPPRARLGKGVITAVTKDREGWFRVSAEGVSGWAPQTAFWGGLIFNGDAAAQN